MQGTFCSICRFHPLLLVDDRFFGETRPWSAGGSAASFDATRWTLCDALVASKGRLGP